MMLLYTVRNTVIGFFYRLFLKPVLFLIDPEKVHDRFVALGKTLGMIGVGRWFTRVLFSFAHPILHQELHGIEFRNPIGLAAGFDKNAELTDILPEVGFGFVEVGSITGKPCAGNPGKRLWRLPKSQSLVVYYGLKNQGADAIAERLSTKQFKFPIGVSVAKTNSPDTCQLDQGIADYVHAFETMKSVASYITLNISCPNVYGGEPFAHPERLEKLLARIDQLEYDGPIFIKLAADHTTHELDDLIDVAVRHRIHGFVCTNLAKDRTNQASMQHVQESDIPPVGGLSGKVVQGIATNTIAHVYRRTKGSMTIIGVGGIFSAQDAYEKIKAGAHLVQLITGMIYQGPQLIGAINQELVELLAADGFESIAGAVGKNAHL